MNQGVFCLAGSSWALFTGTCSLSPLSSLWWAHFPKPKQSDQIGGFGDEASAQQAQASSWSPPGRNKALAAQPVRATARSSGSKKQAPGDWIRLHLGLLEDVYYCQRPYLLQVVVSPDFSQANVVWPTVATSKSQSRELMINKQRCEVWTDQETYLIQESKAYTFDPFHVRGHGPPARNKALTAQPVRAPASRRDAESGSTWACWKTYIIVSNHICCTSRISRFFLSTCSFTNSSYF
jgi:hypothetical protein